MATVGSSDLLLALKRLGGGGGLEVVSTVPESKSELKRVTWMENKLHDIGHHNYGLKQAIKALYLSRTFNRNLRYKS